MASVNAETVANKVIERVRKGQKVKLGEIIKKQGYSDSVSTSPTKVTKTKSYQQIIKPVVIKLKNEIDRIQKELGKRILSGEDYKVLTDALDKQIKNYQLLSGGDTERIAGTFKLEDLFKANANE